MKFKMRKISIRMKFVNLIYEKKLISFLKERITEKKLK